MGTLTFKEVQRLHQTGHLDEAKKGYVNLLADNPDCVPVLHWLGILEAELGHLESAENYLQKAIHLDSSDPSLPLHLANIYKSKDSFSQAQALLLTIVKSHPQFAAAQNNLGTIYYAQNKWHEAITAYQAAINLQANYLDAYYNLGLAYTKAKNYLAASNAYKALIELAPQHPGAHFQLGCLLMQANKYETAIEHFSVITSAHPFHFETQTNLATCYLKLGKLDEAKSHYLHALELMPHDAQVLFNLGVISGQQAQTDEAINYYLQTVKVDPDFLAAHTNLGAIYMGRKNMPEALVHLREAARIQPSEALQHTINIIAGADNLSSSPPEYVRALFDSYADRFDTHLVQALHYQVPQHLAKTITAYRQRMGINTQWDILDLGCGTGLCAEILQPIANSMVGIDLSSKMLEIAAQKNIYTKLIEADIVTFLADKKSQYDLIVAGDVLVYFGELTELFSAVATALKQQGIFVFTTEISDKRNFYMTSAGRFAHQQKYLEALAEKNKLAVMSQQIIDLRTQEREVIRGHIYVLQRGINET